MSIFDDCYNISLANIERPKNLLTFWNQQIQQLNKVPSNLLVKDKKTKLAQNTNQVLHYTSIDKYLLKSYINIPSKIRLHRNEYSVLMFHDYQKKPSLYEVLSSKSITQGALCLRGHEQENIQTLDENESYGYFKNHIDNPSEYYMTKLYLDAYRTFQVFKEKVKKKKIIIFGEGIGAALAMFVAHHFPDIQGLFLESPSFFNLPLTQNSSNKVYTQEINSTIKKNKKNKSLFKFHLNLLDSIHFIKNLECPVHIFADLNTNKINERSAFSLLQELTTLDKNIHIITNLKTENEKKKIILEKIINFCQVSK